MVTYAEVPSITYRQYGLIKRSNVHSILEGEFPVISQQSNANRACGKFPGPLDRQHES